MDNLVANFEVYLQAKNLFAYVIVFIAGVGTSFTPCVYPIMPVTISYIGSQSAGSRFKGFILSIFYVLGMALVYALLGGFAALTGRIFGQWQTSPITYLIVANICILLGLSMLEVFTLPIPGFLHAPSGVKTSRGIAGAFFMGAVSGFIVGPCTAPVLAAILTYVATKQNVIFGMSVLFTFALGMGVLLVVLGTFAGLVVNLPKAGMWMVRVKKVFGYILIIIGEYFIYYAGKLSV